MDAAIEAKLNELRQEIDKHDDSLVFLLENRIQWAMQVGDLKRNNNLPLYDAQREATIIQRIRERAIGFGLDPNKIEEILRKIIELTRHHEAFGLHPGRETV